MKKSLLGLLMLTIANFCSAQAVTKKKKSVKKAAKTINFTPPKIVPDEEVTLDENILLSIDSVNTQEQKPVNAKSKDKTTLTPPPPPPIPKGTVVFKANKIAAEFVKNRIVAAKKYKHSILVEGIVKEVKNGKEEYGVPDFNLIIILDGFPASMDIHCKVRNLRNVNKLSKGMKAVFMAYYESAEDNAIVLNCIYLENPTYE